MRRIKLALGVAALFATACSSSGPGSTATVAGTSATDVEATTSTESPDTTRLVGSSTSGTASADIQVRLVACPSAPVEAEVLLLIEAQLQEAFADAPSPTIELIDNGCFAITTHHGSRAEAEIAAANEGEAFSWTIYLRPVVGGCQVLPDTESFDESDLGPDDPNATQYRLLLGDPAQVCILGPQQGTGEVFENAVADIINGAWGVPGALTDRGRERWKNLAPR